MRKKIIIISIALLGLLGAIEIYVQSDAFAIRIRPYVAGPLKAALGEGAEIGRVKANFIPLYLEVRDLSIPDDQGKQIVAVRKVRVYINPLPLLLKKIRLFSISILEPRIYVKRRSDGVVNLTPFVERIKSNIGRFPQEGQSRFDLLLRTITIRNGQIEFADSATSAELSITSIDMTIRIDLSQERVRAVIRDARLRAFAPGYPELAGNLKTTLEYNRGKLHMESAELSTADAKLAVSGDVGPQPDAALDLRLSFKSGPKAIKKFTDILKPGQKKEVTRMEAAAVIRGKASDPAVEGNIRISDLLFREILLKDAALSFTYRNRTAEIRGKKWKVAQGDKSIVIDSIDANMGYDKGELDIRRFEVLAGDLAFRLKGAANQSKGFEANLSAESSGKGQTLSFFTSFPVEGAVSVSGRLAGALTSPQFDGIISAGPASVRGILFSDIRGGISYKDERIKVSAMNIREQSSRYVLDGSVVFPEKEEPVYAARLQVVRSDVVNIVALFYEHLPLRIAAEGELFFEGTARNYSGSGFLRLESGSAYGETFSRGVISAKLSTGRIAFPQIELFKEQGVVKTSGWIGFDGTYEADLEGRNLDLAAVDHLAGMSLGGKFNIKMHSSGSFSHPYVNASCDVDELLFRTAPVGGMNAAAEIKDGLFTINAGLSEKRVRLAVRWNLHKPYIWNAEAQVKSDTIDPLLVLGNKDLAGSVKVIADGTLTAHGNGLDMSSFAGETVFQKLSMTLGDFRMENEGEASLSVVGGRLKVKTLSFVGPGTRLGITGGAKYPSEIDLTLKGTADLSLLKLLYREVEHTGGTADVLLTIKDEWKNPDVAGELRIRNGDIKLKDVPQRFSALNGRMVFSQGRIVGDSIAAEMGGGTLKASGWAQLSGVSLRNFSVQAAADNVTVRYPAGLVSTLYGELHYDGDASEQSLSGDITIKRARYDKPIEWKTMLVDVGKGLYQKKKTDVGWIGDTQINVRFHGTNDILFQNNFATMPLDVDIFLRGTVNHPQLLGRIEARKGVVYFRKNDFKILHISADFVDPGRMNPVLDIQAETRVREYEIWLSVTGTADRAVVTLMSEPTLNETDILSLLALGKKGSELKGKETGVGVSEAASLATGQFQDIFERRARSLTGLDRFQVDPYVGRSDTSVPRVTVGKELVQSKLFVTYSSNVGASVPEQIFRIEYLLNRHFSLVGESNDLGNTGADIKYRFEFK